MAYAVGAGRLARLGPGVSSGVRGVVVAVVQGLDRSSIVPVARVVGGDGARVIRTRTTTDRAHLGDTGAVPRGLAAASVRRVPGRAPRRRPRSSCPSRRVRA